MLKTKIFYIDGTEEILEHYKMSAHSSGGFAFYITDDFSDFIFIGSCSVRKIMNVKE